MRTKGLIGKKIGMTQVFDPETKEAVPVTVVQVGPCTVTQVKGNAVQLGFIEQKPHRVKRPQQGHFTKAGTPAFKVLREFAAPGSETKPGDVITVELLKDVARVDVTGVSKGRGFQGVVKRHNSSKGDKTHGGHCYRIPGSIGNCSTPSKVWKGIKMPGQMGNVVRSIQNLRIVKTDTERNLLFLAGAVPGARNGIIIVKEAIKG
jgi:large subunit ribosomal protein L3